MKKQLLASCLLFAASSLFASSKPIIFATEATYPPFVSMNADGKMVGFGADIVHAVCQQMHQTCVLKNAPWESLIPGLQMHQFDALFGGMAITPAREQVVNFTQSYYENPLAYVTTIDSSFHPYHMDGETIGVQGGSQFQTYLQTKYGNSINIKTYASNMTALMDMQAGRIDAVFLDAPVAQLWLKKDNHAKQFKIDYLKADPYYFGKGNGIAVNKADPQLLQQLNTALTQIKANGTYQKIVHHWFGDQS